MTREANLLLTGLLPLQVWLFPLWFLYSRWVKTFPGKSWMFVCEEETRINLTRLETMLQRYDPAQVNCPLWGASGNGDGRIVYFWIMWLSFSLNIDKIIQNLEIRRSEGGWCRNYVLRLWQIPREDFGQTWSIIHLRQGWLIYTVFQFFLRSRTKCHMLGSFWIIFLIIERIKVNLSTTAPIGRLKIVCFGKMPTICR